MEAYFVETAGDDYYRIRTDVLREGHEQPTEIFGTNREAQGPAQRQNPNRDENRDGIGRDAMTRHPSRRREENQLANPPRERPD